MIKKIVSFGIFGILFFGLSNLAFATDVDVLSLPVISANVELFSGAITDNDYLNIFLFSNNGEIFISRDFLFTFLIWFWSIPFVFMFFSFTIFKFFKLGLKK